MLLSRRHATLIALAMPVSALGCGCGQGAQVPANEPAAADPVRLCPAQPGKLANASKDTLWALFSEMARQWQLRLLERTQFERILDLKTTIPPSYLAEYESAAAF